MRTTLIFISSLLVLFLFSCSSKTKKAEIEKRPLIVTTNYTIASIVRELVDTDDIKIIDSNYLLEDPSTWIPTSSELEKMNKSQTLVLVVSDTPGWIQNLESEATVEKVTSVVEQDFNPAANPTLAFEVLNTISAKIKDHFPGTKFRDSSGNFIDQLAAQEKKWKTVSVKNLNQKGIERGVRGSSTNTGFISMMETNFQLISNRQKNIAKIENTKARKQEKRKNLAQQKQASFTGAIVPILERACIDCHDEENEEGEINFDRFLTENSASMNPVLWEKVAKVVSIDQMPPPDRDDRLTEEEKEQLQNWAISLTQKWDNGELGKDPGKTTIHRLNKNEYNYTIRDLFDLKIRPADEFPEDGSGESGFNNNANALYLPPLLVENYFKSASRIVDTVYADSKIKARYLFSQPKNGVPAERAAEIVLRYWAAFIYRKRPTDEDISTLLTVFNEEFKKNKNYSEAMKMPLYTMLISPNFLYRSSLTEEQSGAYELNDFELASKLSYFLWSSMPDKELFKLAAQGKLSDENVLEEQVKRMLKDKKAEALGMHLGGQWFGWEELRSAANPDEEKFPQFTLPLRVAFYRESTVFFNELIGANGSIYDFLDSDYTYLNDRLAKFYGISGVEGSHFRKVTLKDKTRGGVLVMGSVLTATSLPLRSSPSIRGAYVLQDVLGFGLPEPPMDVEQVAEDDREIGAKTFRETLVEHSENPNCRNCHTEIDPIGFTLESFDAIGRFRTRQNGVEIDTSGKMPDGTEFTTPAELKKALLNNKEQFARNAVSKILTYALGRELSPYDRQVLKKISDKVINDNGKIQTIFVEVVKSYPFTHRRGDNYKPLNQKVAVK